MIIARPIATSITRLDYFTDKQITEYPSQNFKYQNTALSSTIIILSFGINILIVFQFYILKLFLLQLKT